MRTEQPIREGFVRHKQKQRKPRGPIKLFSWKGSNVGRAAKVLIGLIGDADRSGLAMSVDRRFPSKARIVAEFDRIVPWFRAHYLEARGAKLEDKALYDRYHKQYYDYNVIEGKGYGRVGNEHYSRNKILRSVLPAMDTLYTSGKVLTFEDLNKAGERS